MKGRLFVLVSISVLNLTYAQTKLGLKLYQNTDVFTSKSYYRDVKISEEDHLNFHRITVAMNLEKNDWLHELEIFFPEVSKEIDRLQFPFAYRFSSDPSVHKEATVYSFRYELLRNFSPKKNSIKFSTGVAIRPYYLHLEFIPPDESFYYWSTKFYGLAVTISPRVSWQVAKRFLVDLNVPLNVYDLRNKKNYIANPGIPIRQQTTKDSYSVFFEPVYCVRIGLTYMVKQ